jgi:hypothetical protein
MSLTFDPEKHAYRLDGKRATSVTTILSGGIPKPFLVPWAARVAAEMGWELAQGNMGREQFIQAAKDAPNAERDKAGIRGTAVHAAADQIINGHAAEVTEELYPYVDGYIRFLDAFNVEPILTERTVANRTIGYAGRFDVIARIPSLHGDDPVMIDLKTSNGVYRETKAQCAAYSMADFYVEDDATSDELELPEIAATYVAHVTPEGTNLIPLAKDRDEIATHFEVFKAAHAVYKFGLAAHKVAEPLPYPAIEFEDAS